MSKVEYKKELFDIVKDLSSINNSIIFEKEDDQVLIKRNDAEKTTVYILKAPSTYFDFETDKIAFYNYNEFYQYFSTFENPAITLDDTKINLSEASAKVHYILSNPESIKPGPKAINFGDGDCTFSLDSKALDDIVKMNTLIKAKKAEITGTKDSISIRLYNNEHDNSFDKQFELENLTDFTDDFQFTIFSDLFTNTPLKRNYKVNVKTQGYVKVSLIDDNMDLDIYTGYVKS